MFYDIMPYLLILNIYNLVSQEEQRQEHKLGILLVSISILFICCQSFKIIPDIYELIYCPHVEGQDHECETTPFISTCVSLSHLLVCGNCALNWIVYLLAGEKFRRVWCQTYLPAQCRQGSCCYKDSTMYRNATTYTRTATTYINSSGTREGKNDTFNRLNIKKE